MADRITILLIYMPRIRSEFTEFVRLWNTHRIRKQPTRLYVIPGVPSKLYNFYYLHSTPDFATSIDFNQLRTLFQIFRVDEYNLNTYLPNDTIAIYESFLASISGLPEIIEDKYRSKPFLIEYRRLRVYLTEYIQSGQQPLISLLPKPVDVVYFTDYGGEVFRFTRRYFI